MASFNFKTVNVGDTFTTIEGLTLTITNKVSAHTLYKGSQAFVEYTIDGIEGTHKATSSRLCEICGLTNESATTYKSATTGSRIRVKTDEEITRYIDSKRQKGEQALKVLDELDVPQTYIEMVREQLDASYEQIYARLKEQQLARLAEEQAKAAAAAQAAADKAMAALKALSPEQMDVLLAALAK